MIIGLGLTLRATLFGSAFSPAVLFANNEPGVWYDPSPETTFTDTAGTTPATVGDAVALMLDKSKGLVLGPELVTNGSVSADWTVVSSISLSDVGDKVRATASGTNARARLTSGFPTEVGKTYRYVGTYELISGSNRNLRAYITNAPSGTTLVSINDVARTFEVVFVATSTTSYPWIWLSSSDANQVVDFSGLSVRELPGYHATQGTTAARPILARVPERGRANLLTRTEEFDNAAWVKRRGTISANTVISPRGDLTADTFVENSETGVHDFYNGVAIAVPAGEYTGSVYIKPRGRSFVRINLGTGGVTPGATFDLSTGEASGVTSGYTTSSTFDAASGFWRLTVSATFAATSLFLSVISSNGSTTSLVGLNDAAFDVWGAQIELGSTASAYQKVTSTYDVTEAGQADNYFLWFDGIDDSLVTPTITPGIDKVQVFAGVRKLSAGLAIIAEYGPTRTSGTFWVASDRSVNGTYGFRSVGTLSGEVVAGGYFAPRTNVFTGLGDISGDLSTLRIDGTQVAQNTGDQGTGDYRVDPLYIGSRAASFLLFNGHLYSLITRFGANLEVAQIENTEAYVAGKTAGVDL